MVGPDQLGCPEHGLADWTLYKYKSGRTERRCLACRRIRNNRRHNFESRCRKAGHLKTPWTWKRYGLFWRCLPCQYARRRELAQIARESKVA